MRKILVIGAVVALLAGCDSKPDAPFGLKWGQSMDSISFIKDGDCEKKRAETICSFDNTPPFNDWSYENTLKFKSDKLVEVRTIFNAIDDGKLFCDFLKLESDYLNGVISQSSKLSTLIDECKSIESKPRGSVIMSDEFKSNVGNIESYITVDPYVGIITYSPPTE